VIEREFVVTDVGEALRIALTYGVDNLDVLAMFDEKDKMLVHFKINVKHSEEHDK